MRKLPSEQIPNDGSYNLPLLIDRANERLKQVGRHGKRATIKVTPKPNKPISAQFSLSGQQTQRGLNLPLNKINLDKAEEICALITSQLVANTYSDTWLNSLLGKEKQLTAKKITCKEMLEMYKKHYFKQRKNNKNPKASWLGRYRHTEAVMLLYADRVIDLQIIREIIDKTENNTVNRACHLNGLANLLSYFDNKEFKQAIKQYKKENKPTPNEKYIPSDSEIAYVCHVSLKPSKYCPKKYFYRYPQWNFLYSLLAVYGLRVHEAWNIKNWNNAVSLKNGDWIAIADSADNTKSEDEEEHFLYHRVKKDTVIPAILDPNNQEYLLCIGHNTKTGYRVAFPVCPEGHTSNCRWIKEFNLIQPLNLPDIKNPLEKNSQGIFNCSGKSSMWFKRHKYGFTPHALRHAYNIRGHKLDINHKVLANGLGHGLLMNSSTYLKHEGHESKVQGLQEEIQKDNRKRNEIEELKAENSHLKAEIKKLKTELKMYKMLESKS